MLVTLPDIYFFWRTLYIRRNARSVWVGHPVRRVVQSVACMRPRSHCCCRDWLHAATYCTVQSTTLRGANDPKPPTRFALARGRATRLIRSQLISTSNVLASSMKSSVHSDICTELMSAAMPTSSHQTNNYITSVLPPERPQYPRSTHASKCQFFLCVFSDGTDGQTDTQTVDLRFLLCWQAACVVQYCATSWMVDCPSWLLHISRSRWRHRRCRTS